MKLLIINSHPSDHLGGSEIQSGLIADEMTRRGHSVIYLAPGGSLSQYESNYTVVPTKKDGKEISKQVIDHKPDVVYWRFNKRSFYKAVSRIKRENIPIVFAVSHINDLKPWGAKIDEHNKNSFKARLVSRRNHFGFRYVDALTVNNQDYLNKISIEKQRFIPNGMLTDRVEFNWERPYCVWISNLKRVKQPEKFIELASYFSDRDFDFLMVGAIQHEFYRSIVSSKDLPDNFYFLGPKSIEEVNGILHSSLFHVHTCKPEGFPNVFIQAWLQAKPSVSLEFDPSGYLERFKIGYNTSADWDYFADRVLYLIENPIERSRMGENARNFASKTFTIEGSVDKLELLLEEVVK